MFPSSASYETCFMVGSLLGFPSKNNDPQLFFKHFLSLIFFAWNPISDRNHEEPNNFYNNEHALTCAPYLDPPSWTSPNGDTVASRFYCISQQADDRRC